MEIEVRDSNFNQEVLKSDLLCLVDFWADWCAPCQMIAPILKEIAKDYEGKLKVCKLNVDSNTRIASEYGISCIPMLLIFRNGQVVEEIIGLKSKKEIETKIEPFIN